MSYVYDPHLEFLGSDLIKNEDLSSLFELLKDEISHEFYDYECYKKHGKSEQHKLYWKAIAGELQKFGGNTIANTIRGHGVKYKEIACDVAKKMKIKINKNENIKDIENKILSKLLEKQLNKMTEKEKKQFIEKFYKEYQKLSKTKKEEILKNNRDLKDFLKSQANSQNALKLFRIIFKSGGFKSYQLTVIVANSISKTFLNKGLPLTINAALTKNLALLMGPIYTIISTMFTIYNITGPAYRVTIPGIAMVAMLRKEYEHRKLEKQRRLEKEKRIWIIGIIIFILLIFYFKIIIYIT